MKKFKRAIAFLLVVCMLAGMSLTAMATESTNVAKSEEESEQISTASTDSDFMRILHLDNGRKYFTKNWIIALINEMEAAGYTHLELAFGNDGLRFLLDDMSVGTYTDAQVTAAIQAGNKSYHDFGDKNELTQSEMDEILEHAKNKGISIIPLLNNPGHMNAIVSAITTLTGKSAGYNGSRSTIDLENSAAVSFVNGLVNKYIAYFDSKECEYFNFGADEYANDVYSTGSMGFGALTREGKYSLFVEYVNNMAAMVKAAGMKPVAFNDGIYFNQDTTYYFDTDIRVAFWTSGWSGYQSASASTMAGKGHEMINVNGDYYYVLGKNDQWDNNSYTYASKWDNSTFMGSRVSNPVGGMFCIWCDYPNAETETEIAANTRMILRAMAAEMLDSTSYSEEVVAYGFNEDGTINDGTVEDENTGTDDDTTELLTKTIELVVGESKNVTDSTGNHKTSYTGEGLDTNVANVEVDGVEGVTETTVSTNKATTLEDGATYILRVYDTNYALSSNAGRTDWETSTLAFENNDLTAKSEHLWTLEASEASNGRYKLKNANGYLNLGQGNNTAYLYNTGEDFTITNTSTGWTIKNEYGIYINALGGLNPYYSAGGWTGDGTRFDLYKVTEEADASTDITFTGVTPGTTYVTVGNTKYTIIVSKNTVDDMVTVDAYKTYADSSTNVTVSDTTIATAKLENGTLTISGIAEGSAVITTDNAVYNITVTTVDFSSVDPLEIEYYITNQKVTINGSTSGRVSAENVYSESGVDFANLVPTSDNAENPKVFWKGWLLPKGYYQGSEENQSPDMCTDSNGKNVQKIRYWNGEWAYFDGTQWSEIKSTDQLVAYYLQRTQITDEVTTNVTDWGETYGDWKKNSQSGHWFWQNYVENGSKYVFLDFAVVYEDGTQTPSTFPIDNTWFFHFDGCSETNPRILKPISFDETGDYEIWKITVTEGSSSGYSTASTFTSDYDNDTETIVWSEDMEGEPQIESLSYTANQSGKLIRIYVRAVKTEDTLSVVYYDEKFEDTLYSYNISVASGKNFTNDIVGDTQFTENTERIDVSNAYIINALDKKQYFQTDLTLVPEAVGKYNNGLYTYTGSVISEDGKTLYLYYNIDTQALSPMFVADYGRPFTFDLEQVVTKGIGTVTSVTVNEKTRYGTLEYDATSKQFTYTPTQVLPNIDVLTINIGFAGEPITTTNAGVMPATTVDYEEGFATLTGFTGGSKGTSMQNAWVAGKNPDNDVYGYDSNVVTESNTKATSTKKGNTAEFAFTGTGVDLYINSTGDSGNITVQVRNAENRLVKVLSIQTTSNSKITGDFSKTEQKGLIAGSVHGLAHGDYTVKVTATKDAAVYFDGFRVYGTLQDQANDYYKGDLEDAPMFVELRDRVLAGTNVNTTDSTIYAKDIAESTVAQVYATANSTAGAIVIADNNSGLFEDYDAQALLDNGPKNELFLLPGQSVVFKLTTEREVQVGLKAINGPATVEGSYIGTISSERDMFYTIKNATENEVKETFTITNASTSTSILSITKVKICDDPNAVFGELTAEDLVPALESLGFESEEEPTYADATLNIALNDEAGKALATTALTANGIVGEANTFSAAAIEEAVTALVPEGYKLKDAAYADQEVAYGEEATVTFTAEEIEVDEPEVEEPEEPEVKPEKPQTKPGIISNIVSAVKNILGKLFRWF